LAGYTPAVFLRRKLPGLCVLSVALAFVAYVPAHGADHRPLTRKLDSGGERRSYLLYVPERVAPSPALVLFLHGRGGSPAGIRERTRAGFDALADREGFLVAYPAALHGAWNTGHRWARSDADDVAFLSALIDQVIAEYRVDPRRVYVTGFSNGAGMSYWLACARSDKIAALAPVAGGLARVKLQPCADASKRPIPLLIIHGTADPVIPFKDGELEGNLQYWIRRNGCGLTPESSYLPQKRPAGTRTHILSYTGCTDGAAVKLYALEGCGHQWPGGEIGGRRSGPECDSFDGAKEIWAFFTSVSGT
jgi:polyhydroxybutyrate depolymerase